MRSTVFYPEAEVFSSVCVDTNFYSLIYCNEKYHFYFTHELRFAILSCPFDCYKEYSYSVSEVILYSSIVMGKI